MKPAGTIVERGTGPALVLVPGMPGPARFLKPTVQALAARFRVLTFDLGPECTIESDVNRIAAALDERRIDRAIVCGISLGGLVALRVAAVDPQRTAALVLASTPGPGATLRPRHRLYARWPRVFGPLFLLETPFHFRHDLHWRLLAPLVGRPVSFGEMAARARLIETSDIAADCRRVTAPTLVVTGEPSRDHIVPVANTLGFLGAIPGAEHAVLRGTGHLGSITHPDEFATLVSAFVARPALRTAS